MEEWKPVTFAGFENLYEVSNAGNIRRTATKRVRKTVKNIRTKYETVMLCDNKVNKCVTIHRAVALAFIPNPDNLPQVNHIDHNKSNNSITNLEWTTSKENIRHHYKLFPNKKPFTPEHLENLRKAQMNAWAAGKYANRDNSEAIRLSWIKRRESHL